MRCLPSPVLGISHILHDSLKVANTDTTISLKVLPKTLGCGRPGLEMWSLWNPLRFQGQARLLICTWKIILDGCPNWLRALQALSLPEQLPSHPRPGPPPCLPLPLRNRPHFRSLSILDQIVLFLLPPPRTSHHLVQATGLFLLCSCSRDGWLKGQVCHSCFLWDLRFQQFCLNLCGRYKSRFNIHSDIQLFSEALPSPSPLQRYLNGSWRQEQLVWTSEEGSLPWSHHWILASSTSQNSPDNPFVLPSLCTSLLYLLWPKMIYNSASLEWWWGPQFNSGSVVTVRITNTSFHSGHLVPVLPERSPKTGQFHLGYRISSCFRYSLNIH